MDRVRMKDSLTDTLRSIIALMNKHSAVLDDKWDDLKFPAIRGSQGANAKPDFDETELGLLFPQNNAAEVAYMIGQLSHAWKQYSNIEPHIHFIQTTATLPVFKLAYRWYNNNETPPAFTTITSVEAAFEYSSGSIVQILRFPEIDGTGKRISSILDMKLYRDDNLVTGDVLVKEFDIHYVIDSNGSRQEYIK